MSCQVNLVYPNTFEKLKPNTADSEMLRMEVPPEGDISYLP